MRKMRKNDEQETARVDIVDRTLPHSLEAERACLGAVLVNPAAWPVLASRLGRKDFYRDAHARIFDGMARIVATGAQVDIVMLVDDLKRIGDLDECGGPAYLAGLVDGVPRSTNVESYASIVRETARLRDVIYVSNWSLAEAYEQTQEAHDLAAATARRLGEIGGETARPVSVVTSAYEYMDGLAKGVDIVPTGFATLDELIGGVARGDLTLVAARPSTGKTCFTLGIADNVATSGAGVVYFSLEMRRRKLGARLLAWRSGVPTPVLDRATASETQYQQIPRAVADLDGLRLYVDDASRSLIEIDAWLRRLKAEDASLCCFVVDYLQLLIPGERLSSYEREIAELSSGLKRIAVDLALAAVVLSQLSRAPEARTDKRPHMSDLRGSGCLEQDADLALLLFRQEMYKRTDENDGVAEIIVAKNRVGPPGVVRMFFDKELARFSDLAV